MGFTGKEPDMGDILTTEGLARRLQVRPDTIRRWVHRGLVPVLRVSPKVMRFDLAEVMRALQERGRGGGRNDAR
jgi:excisionase family DNA binding protein